MAQSVEQPTSAQVMISRLMSSSPASGSRLSAQSLLWILSPSLSLVLSLFQKKKKKKQDEVQTLWVGFQTRLDLAPSVLSCLSSETPKWMF